MLRLRRPASAGELRQAWAPALVTAKQTIRLLRESTGFIDALENSPAMLPYAHLLRDLYDPRTRAVKIRESVFKALGGLKRDHDERALVGAVLRRLEVELPKLPLRGIPSEPAARKYVREEKRKMRGQVSLESRTAAHAPIAAPTT